MKNIEIQKEIIGGIFALLGVTVPIVITYLLNKKKKKENPVKGEHIKLKHHPVFVRLKAYESYVKTEFYLENRGKQEVFRDLLIHEIRNRYDLLMELAEKMENCINSCPLNDKNNCNQLYNLNLEYLRKGVEMLANYYKNSDYTPEEQKVLDIVVSKFNRWHEHRVQHMEETLPIICNSRFYADCYTMQAVIFDMYLGAVADMVSDAERTMNEINGDLKGNVFKGIEI